MKQKKSTVPVILIIIAVVYTICPDVLPGPIDDIIIDLILGLISMGVRKAEDKVSMAVKDASVSVQKRIVSDNPEMNKMCTDAVDSAAKIAVESSNKVLGNLETAASNKIKDRRTKRADLF